MMQSVRKAQTAQEADSLLDRSDAQTYADEIGFNTASEAGIYRPKVPAELAAGRAEDPWAEAAGQPASKKPEAGQQASAMRLRPEAGGSYAERCPASAEQGPAKKKRQARQQSFARSWAESDFGRHQ